MILDKKLIKWFWVDVTTSSCQIERQISEAKSKQLKSCIENLLKTFGEKSISSYPTDLLLILLSSFADNAHTFLWWWNYMPANKVV